MKPASVRNPFQSSAVRTALLCTVVSFLFSYSFAMAQTGGAQAAPLQGQAQNPGICGNQPLCYEAADFAATVTDFRISTQGYYKIVDVGLRFQNKTAAQLVLGYNAGSGTALDDRGNRYAVGGANALRGMGLVNGQSFDPKFVLRPASYGDVRFELVGGGAQVYGVSYELNITVSEINTVEGNQHTLGGEFPLQFQGLMNGARATAPGMPAGAAGMPAATGMISSGTAVPCTPAGAPSAIAGATNSQAVQNATAALSSITSLFGKKRQAAPAAANAVATPCSATAPSAQAAQAAPMVAAATAAPAAAPVTATAASPAPTARIAVANAPKAPAQPAKPPAKKPATTTPQVPQPK